jgi:hypothetical protein
MPEVKVEAIKVSDFWTHNPMGWFIQLEAQFGIRTTKVPELTKFFHVIAGLPSNILEETSDITAVAPDDGSYEKLKALLLKTYEKSNLDKSYQLLNYMSRGELTPSQSLAKVNRMWKAEELKKALWLRSLEPELRNQLTGSKTATLVSLAEKADEILEQNLAFKTATPAAAVVASINQGGKSKPAYKKKDYANEPVVDSTGLCYMHRKWGAKAFHCRGAPCTMVGQTTPKPVPGN